MNTFKKSTDERRFNRRWAQISLSALGGFIRLPPRHREHREEFFLCVSAALWQIIVGVLSVLICVSCGRLPPEEFWTGDGSDSTSIHQLIISYDSTPWQGFLSRLDFVTLLDSIRLDTARVYQEDDTSSLEWKIKQAYYPNRLEIALTEQNTDTNIIFSFDTTATVELVTNIKGTARIGCERVQAYRTDTVIAVNRITIWKDDMTNFPTDWTTGGSGNPWTKSFNRFKSESASVKCTPNDNYDNNQDNWIQHSVHFTGFELPSVVFWIWKKIEPNDSVYFECFDTDWHIFWSSSGVDTSFKQVQVPNIPNSVSEIRFRFHHPVSSPFIITVDFHSR